METQNVRLRPTDTRAQQLLPKISLKYLKITTNQASKSRRGWTPNRRQRGALDARISEKEKEKQTPHMSVLFSNSQAIPEDSDI